LQSWDQKDDNELLRLIRDGSHHAFECLVQRHAIRFYRIAYRYMARRQDAEDIVQDAFLKLWEKPHLWQEEKNTRFTTWFYRVLVNLCLDQKKRKPMSQLDDKVEIIDHHRLQDENFAMNEEQKLLEKEIAQLPDRQRTALNLCFYEGLSNQEAAEIMGVNLKALQSLLMRAKTTLKQQMQHSLRGTA